MRLDCKMVTQGLAPTREKARAMIMAGQVFLNGQPAKKAGIACKDDAEITVNHPDLLYVSRGGLKLEKAIREFGLQLQDVVAADIGASTGGFTDCMLQNGAKHVYAIDVGYGQLDWKLRNDPRVQVMERTNARFMEPAWFQDALQLASIDVSFISLRLILPPLFPCLTEDAHVIALVKPQFEAGRQYIQKHGVVRDKSVHYEVLRELNAFFAETGYQPEAYTYSPVTGPKGNIEFLALLRKPKKNMPTCAFQAAKLEAIADAAHYAFAGK